MPVNGGGVPAQGASAPPLMELVTQAKDDPLVLNGLLTAYMPFIKKSAAAVVFRREARREALSTAMLAFVQAVRTYDAGRGAFMPYAGTVIRSRLLDEARQAERRKRKLFSFSSAAGEDEDGGGWEYEASRARADAEEERAALASEIDALEERFADWGIDWDALRKRGPRRAAARRACAACARYLSRLPELRRQVEEKRTLPRSTLIACGFSPRTLEKFRLFILALFVIYSGEFPYLRAFLPRLTGDDAAASDADTEDAADGLEHSDAAFLADENAVPALPAEGGGGANDERKEAER